MKSTVIEFELVFPRIFRTVKSSEKVARLIYVPVPAWSMTHSVVMTPMTVTVPA